MGSGGKKGKKEKKPGLGKEKTKKKTEKAEEKKIRRQDRKLEEDEDDIDAILAKLRLEEAAKKAIAVHEDVPAPSPRCNLTITVSPLKEPELILFGGEYYNGSKTYVYRDLFRYSIDRDRFSHVESNNSPPPRSGHQAVAFKQWIFVFGGEFTSPNQERFHHYKDFWRLDLVSNAWENLSMKGTPSPRSGHRMVVFKHKLILFGGFYDTLRQVKYFNDLHVFDFDDYKWTEVGCKIGALWPSPRSAFQMFLHHEKVFLYGGYFKDTAKKGDERVDKGTVLSDMWMLSPKTWEWEKVKRPGVPPSPRAGFSLCAFKKRVLLFGGVEDVENEKGEVIGSNFLNDLFVLQLEPQLRWFPFALRGDRARKAKGEEGRKADTAAGKIPPPSFAPSSQLHRTRGEAGGGCAAGEGGMREEIREEEEYEQQAIGGGGGEEAGERAELTVRQRRRVRKRIGTVKRSKTGEEWEGGEAKAPGEGKVEEEKEEEGEGEVKSVTEEEKSTERASFEKDGEKRREGERDECILEGGTRDGVVQSFESDQASKAREVGNGREGSERGMLNSRAKEQGEERKAKQKGETNECEGGDEEEDSSRGPSGRMNACIAYVPTRNLLFLYGGVREEKRRKRTRRREKGQGKSGRIGERVGNGFEGEEEGEEEEREVTLDDLYSLHADKLDAWNCLKEASQSEWHEEEDDDEEEEEGEEDEGYNDDEVEEEGDEEEEDYSSIGEGGARGKEDAGDEAKEEFEGEQGSQEADEDGDEKGEMREVEGGAAGGGWFTAAAIARSNEKDERGDGLGGGLGGFSEARSNSLQISDPFILAERRLKVLLGEDIEHEENEGGKEKLRGRGGLADSEREKKEDEGLRERKSLSRKERGRMLESVREELRLSDEMTTPTHGESLRDFFFRTLSHWQKEAFAETQHMGKELRRDGFSLCEARYLQLQPILFLLERLETVQQEMEKEESLKSAKASPSHSKGRMREQGKRKEYFS